MALHPQAAAFLSRLVADGVPPAHLLSIDDARRRSAAPPGVPEPVREVVDTVVPGPVEVPVRVVTPHGRARGIVVYLHGGGHVTGSVASYDHLVRRLAVRVPAVVVAVDYRLAPEHRCPAAVDDAATAREWVLQQRERLTGDPAAPVAVAGDSAGANNAAVLSRRLRDSDSDSGSGGSSQPVLQVLVYPPVDAVAYRQAAYPSHTERGSGYGLVYEDGLHYWEHYLGPDGDPASPDASPLRAPSMAGLAPAYVLTVEYDVLRDEGRAYADRLREAGIPVEHRHWDGHLHGFLGDPTTFSDADDAMSEIAGALRAAMVRLEP